MIELFVLPVVVVPVVVDVMITAMIIDVIYGKFFFLVTMTAAVVGFVGMVRYANWSIGIRQFSEILEIIKSDPVAAAEYFKGRLISIAIIVGASMLAGAII